MRTELPSGLDLWWRSTLGHTVRPTASNTSPPRTESRTALQLTGCYIPSHWRCVSCSIFRSIHELAARATMSPRASLQEAEWTATFAGRGSSGRPRRAPPGPNGRVRAHAAPVRGRGRGRQQRNRVGRADRLRATGGGRCSCAGPTPPPPPRTKWTRRIPHPVLIGHAASLPPYRPHGRSRRSSSATSSRSTRRSSTLPSGRAGNARAAAECSAAVFVRYFWGVEAVVSECAWVFALFTVSLRAGWVLTGRAGCGPGPSSSAQRCERRDNIRHCMIFQHADTVRPPAPLTP